ncbi:PfkB family carbohydrate kinase [Candidatus Burkholderia verschuerenii]|uniref:PfkB family carbohydrate kinase n=1 Tax=Candidatus Burkholderia verschuerenii TaxID=242163 RepID=UPI000A892741|nr:PfkB family carbohydrate kinase [Candidatus Burkholderia verschuerenii]
MTHTHDVSVCGTYILDILGVPVTEIPPGGSRVFLDEIRLTVAGTAGGTVVPCARLGLKALAVGAVGTDEKADWIINTLDNEGIDSSLMERIEGAPTSATILPIRPDGSRPVLHARAGAFRPTCKRPRAKARCCISAASARCSQWTANRASRCCAMRRPPAASRQSI